MRDHRRPSGALRAVRAVLVAVLPLLAMLVGPASVASASSRRVSVHALQADYRMNPMGIDDAHPSLSWQLDSKVNGERQRAYRLLVATSPNLLEPGRADVWDTGKVKSEASVAVPYAGPNLRSAHRYYWTVQVWDAQGQPSEWAATAWWEMGLLKAEDWKGARWISPDTGADDVWSDFTVDLDFTIRSGAASVLFRAQDSGNCYMWQVNTELAPGRVLLRPHVQVNGSWSHLGAGDIDISNVITQASVTKPHHTKIKAEGSTITTWVDGTQVDTRTDGTFSKGTIGFRVGDSTEDSLYDNVVVRNLNGDALFSDDFSTAPDPSFPQTRITDGQLEPGNGIVLVNRDPGAPMLRREFALDKPIAQARAYVYGLGFYELHLNGAKVGDRVLTPVNTPYDRRNVYDTYDVTRELKRGANAVGLWLGNGYGSRFNPYGYRWLGPKQAIMLLDVTYTDGTHQTVTTDNSWTWSTGAITANDIYDGETYDARLRRSGWDRPGLADTTWKPVQEVAAPSNNLVADAMPPMRVVQTVHPVKLTEPAPGIYVYDLGQNIAGWARLHVQGAAGTTVRMRTAEELQKDGTLDTVTNRNAASTDTYILAGTGGVETYEPRFTYHGFRYVEVTGYPGTPTLDSLDGRAVHADVPSTGTFESSDALLDKIWQNNRWTILNNSMSIPTDNPVRDERTPPGMDVQAYHDASTREFDMDAFYANYLLDMPPGTALPNDAGNSQNPDMSGNPVTLAWTLYEQYGDRATLAHTYPAMTAFVDTNDTNVPNHIWPENHGFGDWCPPDHGPDVNGGLGSPRAGSCTSEVSLVNTALSYLQAVDVAKAAQALGHSTDVARYTRLAADIKDAFNATFLNDAGDRYGDGRQVTSVLPLAFGMVPTQDVDAVGRQLVNTILDKDAGHLDTGIFGTRYLLDALARIDRIDVAMTILNQRTYPGFGFEISQGATSSWEEWLYASGMETHDHAMFAGINASLYTKLAGIEPASAGYANVAIAPQVPDDLSHVSASLNTVRGEVGSSWTKTDDAFDLHVTVPVNATATVEVPMFGGSVDNLRADRGSTLLRVDGGTAVFAVGSGHWHFVTKTQP